MDNVVLALSGREFKDSEIRLIKEIVEMFPWLTRSELIETICENMDLFTPGGRGKKQLCSKLLQQLEEDGAIALKYGRSKKERK